MIFPMYHFAVNSLGKISQIAVQKWMHMTQKLLKYSKNQSKLYQLFVRWHLGEVHFDNFYYVTSSVWWKFCKIFRTKSVNFCLQTIWTIKVVKSPKASIKL